MIRGTGARVLTRPHTAKARTSWFLLAVSKEENRTLTWSMTSTRIKGVGARRAFGVTTPVTEPGKLTLTWLPGVVLAPSYPFKAAYWQGAAVDPAAQSKGVPAVNPP